MPSRHRRVRPRYGRLAAAVSSLTVTSVAVLGGVGVLPSAVGPQGTPDRIVPAAASDPGPGAAAEDAARPTPGPRAASTPSEVRRVTAADLLPADSGRGRRVVYSEGMQRVWLVGDDDGVRRTYLVSGSVYDNLDPGTYEVYSRSSHAVGIDDSGTMRHFVRFTRGDTGAAIGFHDIPVDDGRPVQGVDELGTPTSHGCIRQGARDARALWRFAPEGTTVVVTA